VQIRSLSNEGGGRWPLGRSYLSLQSVFVNLFTRLMCGVYGLGGRTGMGHYLVPPTSAVVYCLPLQ
jgi:hypothetical protein